MAGGMVMVAGFVVMVAAVERAQGRAKVAKAVGMEAAKAQMVVEMAVGKVAVGMAAV